MYATSGPAYFPKLAAWRRQSPLTLQAAATDRHLSRNSPQRLRVAAYGQEASYKEYTI